MLEIIALILLTKRIGVLAEQKGLKPGTWKLYTVLVWLGSEIVGVLLGIILFGQENILMAGLMGLGFAIASFFILRANLNKKPDSMDEDINRIGVKDLYP